MSTERPTSDPKPKRVLSDDGELVEPSFNLSAESFPPKRKRVGRPRLMNLAYMLSGASLMLIVGLVIIGSQLFPGVRAPAVQGTSLPLSRMTSTPLDAGVAMYLTDCHTVMQNEGVKHVLNVYHDTYSLFLQDAGSGMVCQPKLPNGAAVYSNGMLSPDQRILFVVRYDQVLAKSDLYVGSPDGSDWRSLGGAISTSSGEPQWSPDKKQLLYIDTDQPLVAGGGTNINVVSADAKQTRLILHYKGAASMPHWSPDGKQLVFIGSNFGFYQTATYSNATIFTANVADGTIHRVADYQGNSPVSPSWSPDGKQFVFGASMGMPNIIYTMNVNGSGLRAITDGSVWSGVPFWSADGKQIYFSRYSPDSNLHTWVMDADSQNVRQASDAVVAG